MITELNIRELVPRFILQDRNGAAMAAAILRGLEIFCRTVQEGLDLLLDVDSMPDWRLDELAEELGCVYNRSDSPELKRESIKNAWRNSGKLGTAAAIEDYLRPRLGGARVAEWPLYGGEPYHFKITAAGINAQTEDALAEAVDRLKNLRSVFDGFEEIYSGTFRVYLESSGIVAIDENTIGSIILDVSGVLS